MNKEEFIKYVKELGIDVTEEQLDKLNKYYIFLIEYNNHTNLTAITEEKEVYLKHFYDSLAIVKSYTFSNEKVLDIGTGAGFPGIVLKIFYPDIDITLLDSNNKKITFLEKLVNLLKLEKVNIINKRAEDYIKEKREYFDVVTSRAVANLTTLSEISLPFTRIDGYFIPMKGANNDELKEAEYAINVLGGKLEKTINFNLPIEDSNRNIFVIKKIKKTPNNYPRQYSQIIKNPLKKKVK